MHQFEEWLLQVKTILVYSCGCKPDMVLSARHWRSLYDAGFTPLKAVSEDMEYKVQVKSWVEFNKVKDRIRSQSKQ